MIHISRVRPAGWGLAWPLGAFSLEGIEGGGGWHVAQETAGCLPTGGDVEAGAAHTRPSVRLTVFSLLVSMWIMESARIRCRDMILNIMLPHMLNLTF